MSTPKIDQSLRAKIMEEPAAILDDRDLMNALIAANDREIGANVVDLRGIAMERLEARLDRLEDNHRSVIAAAYENLAGTNQVHRALLRMLDPLTFCARSRRVIATNMRMVDGVPPPDRLRCAKFIRASRESMAKLVLMFDPKPVCD